MLIFMPVLYELNKLNLFFLQVLEMESLLLMPDLSRGDLADLLKAVQAQEKQKLHLVPRLCHMFLSESFSTSSLICILFCMTYLVYTWLDTHMTLEITKFVRMVF